MPEPAARYAMWMPYDNAAIIAAYMRNLGSAEHGGESQQRIAGNFVECRMGAFRVRAPRNFAAMLALVTVWFVAHDVPLFGSRIG